MMKKEVSKEYFKFINVHTNIQYRFDLNMLYNMLLCIKGAIGEVILLYCGMWLVVWYRAMILGRFK